VPVYFGPPYSLLPVSVEYLRYSTSTRAVKSSVCTALLVVHVVLQWDTFSLPELEAFLRILDREEESYRYQLQLKYGAKKRAVEVRLKQLADANTISA